ncbi:HU family DNA-binding protein [Azospirillum brasilense]|uniref:HU family DNA-binding protein n=1 Tax=Azospirillum brasilense TaxID=192 RepID=UPI002494F24C|nr:HU family DNA-binding protein [Azospirillum brasilense]
MPRTRENPHARRRQEFRMNQAELIETIATNAGIRKSDAAKVVQSVFEGISSALARGEEVRLAGFGIFEVAERAAREGRNPRTGEAVQIAASKAPRFKPAKQLRDVVNV